MTRFVLDWKTSNRTKEGARLLIPPRCQDGRPLPRGLGDERKRPKNPRRTPLHSGRVLALQFQCVSEVSG